jgi:hypothetical protein
MILACNSADSEFYLATLAAKAKAFVKGSANYRGEKGIDRLTNFS